MPRDLTTPERPYIDDAWGALASAVYSSGSCESVLRHEGPVADADFSPDGKSVISTSADGTASVAGRN